MECGKCLPKHVHVPIASNKRPSLEVVLRFTSLALPQTLHPPVIVQLAFERSRKRENINKIAISLGLL